MEAVKKKLLSCMFLLHVLCSYRRYEKTGIMDRCLECSHYKRFLREMAEQDLLVMDEIDEIRRTEVWK